MRFRVGRTLGRDGRGFAKNGLIAVVFAKVEVYEVATVDKVGGSYGRKRWRDSATRFPTPLPR